MASRDAPASLLLLAVTALFAGAALWLRLPDVSLASPVLAILAAVLLWIATRPWHPVVAPLYRRAVREAWTDWVEAVERWQAREDRKGADEAERATEDLVTRLRGLRPPRSERDDHAELVRAVAAYAGALAAWHAAPDDPEVADRLQAAHDALSAEP